MVSTYSSKAHKFVGLNFACKSTLGSHGYHSKIMRRKLMVSTYSFFNLNVARKFMSFELLINEMDRNLVLTDVGIFL